VTSPQEAVLERVRKLLALSTSPNVHEAALAAARAQALIERHRLEGWLAAERSEHGAADADPITDGRDAPLEVSRRVRKWKGVLASTLAELNGCVAWVSGGRGRQAICVVGRDVDRAAVQVLWDGLVRRIEWASASAGEGRDRAWHDAFRVGAAETIGQALREARVAATSRPSDTPSLSDGERAALVRVAPARAAHDDALERYVRERLGPDVGRRLWLDAEGLAAGRAAGRVLDVG